MKDIFEGLLEGTPAWYIKAWSLCKSDLGYDELIKKDAKKMLLMKEEYLKVGKATGVPWFVIGAIHYKECGSHPKGCLANGQRIIGTGRLTSIVPKGRGPYSTFFDSAIDALKLLKFDRVKDWSIGNMLFLCEKYNGTGYIKGAGRAETSPYLWARTNINDDRGLYVADGKFDPNAPTNKTSGICAILKYLEKSGEITLQK